MKWLTDLVVGESVAQAILVIGLVAAGGLAFGSLKIRGIGLGVAGVLFAGLLFGHFGIHINKEVMEFAREFGLILFVYTIGIQVGPGFFGSLRKQGAPLNAMAAAIVLLGATIALLCHLVGGIDIAAAAGLFSGATTNTPSLGAVQQALTSVPGITDEMTRQPGLAYAVSYPFGIVGIILAMLVIRLVTRSHVPEEEERFKQDIAKSNPPLATLNMKVTNQNLNGMKISAIPGFEESGVVISRLHRDNVTRVAQDDMELKVGDILLAVGRAESIETLRIVIGEVSELDLKEVSETVNVRRIVATKKTALGKSIEDLNLEARYHVRFTRLSRAEVDLPNPASLRLQAGDALTVVGEEGSLDKVAKALGNSMKDLDIPQIIPIFLGIVLGIILGSIPIMIPGIPVPVKLGLAGGPLIVAILLSFAGRLGPLVWFMPTNANFLLREIGIVMFLAVVGIKSGGNFVNTLVHGQGLLWMLYGAIITFVPLMIVGLIGKMVLKLNYLTVCGVLSGSMTDPPALAFANSLTKTAAPAVSYATVYPMTMLLRVVCAQALVLAFA